MKKEFVIGLVCITGVLLALPLILSEVRSASAGVPGRVNPPTHLFTVSGNKLAKACRSEAEGSFEDGICLGYVLATSDAVNNGSVDGKEACTPAAVPNVQVQYAARKYLADHPEPLDRSALELVAAALAEAFRCSGSEHQEERPHERL